MCTLGLAAQTEEWEFYSVPSTKGPMVDTPNYIYYSSNPGLGRINRVTQQVELFYTFNSGLPIPALSCLYFDNTGLLWIGGGNTLASFDGISSWQTYDLSSAPAEIVSINAIHKDSGGMLWLGCSNGLFKTDFNTWTHFDETNTPLPNMNVWRIEIDHLDRVWIGNAPYNGDLAYYDGNSWTLMGSNFDEMYFILEDLQHNIWVGSFNLRKYDGTGWTTIPQPPVSSWAWNWFTCADVDANNRLYVGTLVGEIFILDNGVVSQYLDDNPECIGSVQSLVVDAWGYPYYASNKVYFNYQEVPGTYIIDNTNSATGFCRDSQNYLWVAHGRYGLSMFDGTLWHSFGIDYESHLDRLMVDLAMDAENTLWALQTDGVIMIDNGVWSYFQPPDFCTFRDYTCLEIDIRNNVWIGSNNGLICRNNDTWQHLTTQNSELPDNQITDMVLDTYNRLWIASCQTIALYDRGTWQVYNDTNAPFTGLGFTDLFCDYQNRIWARTSTYLYCWDNGIWTAHQLPFEAEGFGCLDLGLDSLGRIWVSLGYNGVGILDGTDWQVWTSHNSYLQGSAAYSIFSEPDGRIWLFEFGGLQTCSIEWVEDNDPQLVPVAEIALRCYPNPARENANISIRTKFSDLVSVQVFNLRGQLVKDLGSRTVSAFQEQIVLWDAKDNEDRKVAASVYLVRIKSTKVETMQRIVILH